MRFGLSRRMVETGIGSEGPQRAFPATEHFIRLTQVVVSRLLFVLLSGVLVAPRVVCAQTAAPADRGELSLDCSIFVDTYYSQNLNSLPTRNRPYTTLPLYNEEPALNLAYLDVTTTGEDVRSRLAAQHGSSVVANYDGEPDLFWRYIQEAYGGYQIADGLWLDAGVFLSHIGLESWVSRDNWTYTRSLIADYSPYYQSGAKLSYRASEHWSVTALALRGWQNISEQKQLALGTQVSYTPSDATLLTYNTFLGDEHGTRFFNNVLARRQISETFGLAASLDVGFQERHAHTDTATWHGWALIAQYKVKPSVRIAARVERYADPHQVILTSESESHVAATGLSVNVDVDVATGVLWRTEYRVLMDNEEVFPRDVGYGDDESFVVTSLAYSWESQRFSENRSEK